MNLSDQTSILKWKEGEVGWIEINRENKLNALNLELLKQLSTELDVLSSDSTVRCIVITGKGEKAFCAGADIEYYVDLPPLKAQEFMQFAQEVLNKIERMPKPVIAAVNGYALGGGCELSLVCDLRIASENAQFGLPEVNLGLFPGWGGTQRLPRIAGIGVAKHMIFTGERVKAQQAEQIGLVSKVVPFVDLRNVAQEVASKLATRSPIGLKLAKDTLNHALEVNLDAGLRQEAAHLALVYSSKDAQEGIQAFLQKRLPIFTGE